MRSDCYLYLCGRNKGERELVIIGVSKKILSKFEKLVEPVWFRGEKLNHLWGYTALIARRKEAPEPGLREDYKHQIWCIYPRLQTDSILPYVNETFDAWRECIAKLDRGGYRARLIEYLDRG